MLKVEQIASEEALRRELVALLPKLRRFAIGLAGSTEEGDDVTQAACERALSRLNQFQPGTRLDSWMYRIVQTVWIDRRRAGRNREIGTDVGGLDLFPGGNAAEEMESRLTLKAVRREIAKLPEDQRVVMMLVTVEGVSYKDAAQILSVPIGTVMSRLARARLALGQALGGRA
jgi:RNA polymerase sigma-70 factor (ECF subfamily)